MGERQRAILEAQGGEGFRKEGGIKGPREVKRARKTRLRNVPWSWVLGHLEPSGRLTD